MEYLYDKLKEYKKQDIYPMHMPGHKRNLELMGTMDPYAIDITEIDGFDNLHDAQEILKEQMEEASNLYGSAHTNYLINGSTSGLLVAIAACTKKGDTVLVARNCHKAVYHGIFLQELVPIYLYPEVDEAYGIQREITPEQVKGQLEKNPEIKLVLLTSPTYEGIVSDIASIANVVHAYHIPLVVDEAHGAHLGFHSSFPDNSIACGADLVIHSVHKTLPAFTQTALLHSNGDLVDYDKVRMYLQIFQTSSPSYVLMAGISNCLRLVREQGASLFERYVEHLTWFYKQCEKLESLRVYMPWKEEKEKQPYAFDPSKIVIFTQYSNITGVELYEMLLQEYRIQCEMQSKNYVLAMTSIADTEEGFHRLMEAILAIDNNLKKKNNERTNRSNQLSNNEKKASKKNSESLFYVTNLTLVRTPYEAYNLKKESISLENSVGRVAGEQIYLYPPGIPLVVPGEQITEEVLQKIQEYQVAGLQIKGMQDESAKTILVVGEEKNG